MGARQAQPVPLQYKPGLFTNETPNGAKGRWIDGDNVRWHEGLPEKMGGYELQDLLDPTGVITTYTGKVRSTWEWDSLDSETWIAFGTACKLYLVNRGVLYDITPMRSQSALLNAITTVNGSPIATIVDPNHGAQEGDHLKFVAATSVGGVTLFGYYDVVSVLGIDSYTINMRANATSSVTGGGNFSIQYDINCGLESDGALFGYGIGPYGAETYGTARSSSTYIGKARVWSLDNWGEDLLASPNGEALYEWRRTWGPDSRATLVAGAPNNIEHMLVGPDDRHVIALGSNLVSTGVHDKMFVRWCKGDDYNTWLSTSVNDAGSKRLDTGSRLITAVKTNRGILIFANRAIYWLSVVGGQDVYSIELLGQSVEIISAESVVDVDGTVYFMARDDFYMFDGVLHQMSCDIKLKVFGTATVAGLNQQMGSKVHARIVKEFNEIWWSYATGDSAENNATAIYSYGDKCWYYSSIPREAGRDSSPSLDRRPYAFYNGRFWLQEEGTDGDDGDGYVVPLHSFLQSYEGELQEGAIEVRVSKIVPAFKELDGLLDVSMTGRERPMDGMEVGNTDGMKTSGPYLVTPATKYVCPDIRVRQLAIAIDSNDLGVHWRMGTWRAYITPTSRKSS